MFRAFISSWVGWLWLGGQLLRATASEGVAAVPRRAGLFLVGWVLFGVLNLLHWLGFALDEVLFPRWRGTRVTKPLFIVGVPRSGTTFLHRTLAEDENFTSLSLFECLFAPSVSERYLWHGLQALAGAVGHGLRRMAGSRKKTAGTGRLGALLQRMDQVHRLRFDEAEEDFLLLLPVQGCFLGALVCPRSESFWELARFDEAVGGRRRRVLLDFYRCCVQKHLFFHGRRRSAPPRLLSKNPSFTSWVGGLRERFPDAAMVACVREPTATVPSQFNALGPAWQLLGARPPQAAVRDRLLDMLHGYYAGIAALQEQQAGELLVVPQWRIRDELEAVVGDILGHCGHEASREFVDGLGRRAAGSRKFTPTSAHVYADRLQDFGLDEQYVAEYFADVWPGGEQFRS